MAIFRVDSECYDKLWLVNAPTPDRAIEIIESHTEELGWDQMFGEGEEIDFSAEEILEESGSFREYEDL